MPRRDDREPLPSTLERSPARAQRTWRAAYESARETYGEEGRARRVAFAALKHSFEKVGDHWEAKARRGPSDDRAAQSGPDSRTPTRGGVDAHATLTHLRDLARRLQIPGRSRMGREELVREIERANRRSTAQARRRRT